MGEIVDLTKYLEGKNISAFAGYLVETAQESMLDDFQPRHFCLIAQGPSACGGEIVFSSLDETDAAALETYIGKLQAEVYRACAALDRIDSEER